VLLDDIDAFNDNMVGIDALGHNTALALVTASQHDDLIAFANLVHDRSLY
jgi:hypothetical protein